MAGLVTEFGALDELESYIGAFPEASRKAARIALNEVAEGVGLTMIRSDIEQEINFPPGYLNKERLGVTQRARNDDLAVTITGRFRPTSLARFATNRSVEVSRRNGVDVKVKRGGAVVHLARAFLVRLNGAPDSFNLGLAIRLKPGEVLTGSTGAYRLDEGLYLLYGPSVDQVFREVGPADAPEILADIGREFFRQLTRLLK